MWNRRLVWIAVIFLSMSVHAREGGRASKMDHGPVMANTFGVKNGNVAMKGLAIRLAKENPAYLCFDTELLRVSATWTGEYIDWRGINLEGGMTYPKITGDVHTFTDQLPGWAPTEDLKDPRPFKEAPLPAQWGKYKGLYIHGERVVLAYSVNGCDVLELPGVERSGETTFFTRTFKLGASAKPAVLVIADMKGGSGQVADQIAQLKVENRTISAGAAGLPAGAEWKVNGSAILLTLPPSVSPRLFKVIFGRTETAALKALLAVKVEDFESLTKGGAARYAQTLETKGELGKDPGGYVVDTITAPEENPWKSWMRLAGFDFFADGKRAAVCSWSGDVWTVSGIDETLEKLTWRRFATGLYQPLGLKIVDDSVHITGRDQITRLHDLNKDGEADYYENFNNDGAVSVNFHEFTMELQTDAAGNFYYSKGQQYFDQPTAEQRQTPQNGCLVRVSKDGGKLDVVATGFRAVNGFGISADGALSAGDNQGHWVPTCSLYYPIKNGGYYGFPFCAQRTPVPPEGELPLCWLPMEGDNSPGGQTWVTSTKWGPFSGKMLHTSYGKCTLFHVFTQQAGAVLQGGVVPFPLRFGAGVMRARFNPLDGQLYLCGLRGWDTTAVKDAGFVRVRYTGKAVNMPLSLIATQHGMEIAFTDALDVASATSAENYSIEVYNVRRSANYGSPEYSIAEPTRKGRDALAVEEATLSKDGKTVSLEIPFMAPATNVIVTMKVKMADGQTLKHRVFSTIHQVPVPETKPGGVRIARFTADRAIIENGTGTLTWAVENATRVRIDPEIGAVALSGTRTVSLKESRGYKLIAEGPGGPVYSRVRVEVMKLRAAVAADAAKPGLLAQYYELKKPNTLPDYKKLKPYLSVPVAEINSPPSEGNVATSGRADEVGAVFSGFVRVPADGIYTFTLGSDDGSRMFLHGEKIIESDRQQNFEEASYVAALKAGLHPVRIDYFENGGGAGIVLSYESAGIPKQVVPAAALVHLPE